MIVFPNCKINLGLNVLKKREDGFHDLETVFYPLPLLDILEIIESKKMTGEPGVPLSKSGLSIDSDNETDLCIKAYRLLKKEFPGIPPVQMHLHKTIPVGGGLGGGSADAAFALILLNEMCNLQLSKEQLIQFASQLGSDCPFFIINKPCFSKGRGEILEEIRLDLSAYKFILVNPGIHINTAAMFREIKPAIPKISLNEMIRQPLEKWKDEMTNDFEENVFRLHPETRKIKNDLYNAAAVYASMSGSGSTIYGVFSKEHSPDLSFPAHYFIREILI